MSYQVLARKWRPRCFNDMVGQEHILRMLTNALEQQRIHHAYLFTGTRGVGKTTIARILAKCLNCESGITANPCGTCGICVAIDNGQFLDLYEVDAASRTKVEDTRELLDNVMYPPSQGRYKIYLIDEVHMLSNHSFNALLKTLEEPPEHVKFLLATTDPKKLPVTILSRCLQFYLKRIVPEQISAHLEHICQAETIAFEKPALIQLAKAADGSMRDALSLLDQAIAYGHGQVKKADMTSMLGSMAQEDLYPLIEALAEKNGAAVFSAIKLLAERAPDYAQLLEELISLFHQTAVAQVLSDTTAADSLIQSLAARFNPDDIQLYYQIALLGRRDLAYSPSPLQGFEMTLLRMLAFKPVLHDEASTSVSSASATKPIITTTKPAAVTGKMPIEAMAKQGAENWPAIVAALHLTGMTHALAANCILVSHQGAKIELALAENHIPMLNPKSKERIAEALSTHFKQPIELSINPTKAEIMTPAKQQQQAKTSQVTSARSAVLKDPKINQLIEAYDATVEVTLIS